MRQSRAAAQNQPPTGGDRHQSAAGDASRGGDLQRAAADRRPARVRVRAAEGQSAAAGNAKALLPMMFPAKVVVEPEDGATVNVEG